MEKFMESGVGAGAMLTDHEPGWTPGGGTPAATEARFMESHLFEIDLLTALEPRNCKSLEINETISRFMERLVGEGAMPTDHEPGEAVGLR